MIKCKYILPKFILKSKISTSYIINEYHTIRLFSTKSKKNRQCEEPTFITSPGQNRWRTLGDDNTSISNELPRGTTKESTNNHDNSTSVANNDKGIDCEDKLLLDEYNLGVDGEKLTPEQENEKAELVKELTKRLRGPLADENGNIPTGDKRPIAIEVDGPSHFYANSTNYTAYTKLKHRLLTRMGYKVLHVPYFEWRRLRGAREREDYMRAKLAEEPTEWLDPEDEKFYSERLDILKQQFSSTPTPTTVNSAANDVKNETINR